MSHTPHRRLFVVATEIIAIIATTLTTLSLGPTPAAVASVEQPVVAYATAAPSGITIDSPWVIDATGSVAWALGVNSSGMGVLARRELATTIITTTPTVTGEIGATEGRLITPTGNIAFLAKRQGAGGRLVVINPTTSTRVSTYDLAAADTNPRGIGFPTTGASIYLGSNSSTSQVLKITAATGALSSSANLVTIPATSGITYGGKFYLTSGTTAPRLITMKDTPPIAVETSTTLTGLTQSLVDPALIGSVAWFGTETGQGRLVAIDLATKLVTANFALGADEVGLRNITIPPGSTFAYGTTVAAGRTRLVTIRLSDGARLGTTDLGASLGATSISVNGRYVDVSFPGSTAFIRLTTAAPPTAPTGLSVSEGAGSLTASWTASTSAEPAVSYLVTATSGGQSFTCSTTSTSCVLTELTNGAVYSVSVTAQSRAGSTLSASIDASPFTLPSAVTAVGATRGNGAATIRWTPGSDGGRSITGYTATAQPGGLTCISVSTECVITGLSNGTSYTTTVIAHTSKGDSVASAPSAPVIPATTPLPPRSVVAVRGDRQVTVSWLAPVFDGGDPISTYRVISAGNVVCTTTARACVVAGLTNGTPVAFSVTAVNSVGSSPVSIMSDLVTPATTPDAPTGVTAVRGNRMVSLSWLPPAVDGGEPVIDYTVNDLSGNVVCTTANNSCSVTGLTNGTPATFSVSARNAVGQSVLSSPSNSVTPATNPDAPTGVTAVRGNQSVSLSWTAPEDDGGEPVIGYTVLDESGSPVCQSESPSCTVDGLTNGTPVSFTVIARNDVGSSAASIPSIAVTPATVPGAATGLWVERADSSIRVGWSDTSDGGAPISSYSVTTVPESPGCVSFEPSCEIVGLTNGIAYAVTVVAHNAVGSGEASAEVLGTPATVPGVPVIHSVDDEIGRSTVNWSAPLDGGEPLIGYRVTLWDETSIVATHDTNDVSFTLDGLNYPSRMRVTVEAMNSLGSSAWSTAWVAPSAPPPPPVIPEPPVVPEATVPESPRATLRSVTRTTYTLSWVAPRDGGSAIVDYRIATRVAGAARFTMIKDGVSARRTVKIPRPRSGKSVYVRIVAVNSVGTSTPPTTLRLKGTKAYLMPSVVAVRFNDAAALAGLVARSTP